MILDGKGRFVLLEKPAAYPFTDIVTTTAEGPVFDLSVDLEFFNGVVYLKAEHVEEMAHTLGMVTKEEADELRAQITKLEEEKNTLPVHVERLIHGINASLVSYADSHSAVPITVPVYLQDIDPGTQEPDSADLLESAGTGQSAPAGIDIPAGKDSIPAVSKGSAKLPSSTGNGLEF